MKVIIEHIRPNYAGSIYVQWTLENPDASQTSALTFDVQRSGSAFGEWETVAQAVEGPVYEDVLEDSSSDVVEINISSFRREIWYRVIANLDNGVQQVSTPVDQMNNRATSYDHTPGVGIVPREDHTTAGRPNLFQANPAFRKRLQLVQRSILRKAAINLRLFSGIEMVLLKRRRFGPRCLTCYNGPTKQPLISKCKDCYGTGFQGGYWEPIIVSVLLRRNPTQMGVSIEGDVEVDVAQAHMLDFPRVEREDVLVNLDNRDIWVLTQPARLSALKHRQVTQSWSCAKLDRNDGPYSVSLDLEKIERAHNTLRVEFP